MNLATIIGGFNTVKGWLSSDDDVPVFPDKGFQPFQSPFTPDYEDITVGMVEPSKAGEIDFPELKSTDPRYTYAEWRERLNSYIGSTR